MKKILSLFRRPKVVNTSIVSHITVSIQDEALLNGLIDRNDDLLEANTRYYTELQARGNRIRELEAQNADLLAQIPVAA